MEFYFTLLQAGSTGPSSSLLSIIFLIVIIGLLYLLFKKDSKGNRFKISREGFSIVLILLSTAFLVFLLFATLLTNKEQHGNKEIQGVIIAAVLSAIGLILGILMYSQKKQG